MRENYTIKKIDAIDMMKDILSGDENLLKKWENNINAMGGMDTIQTALKWLQESDINQDYKNIIASEGWRLNYYRKPPTPEEFLTYDWIGPQAESTWPNVKKCFIEFMDPNPLNPKRNLALSTSIGWGKDQPIDSNIVIDKNIELELENDKKLSIPSNEEIEVIENGKKIKIKVNELLQKNLDTIDLPQKIKKISYSYKYKKLKDIKIGDKVLSTDGCKVSVLNIQKNGLRDIYKITLSDDRYFYTSETHNSLVHFRNSYTRPDKKVYDVLTTKYIKDHLNKYLFEIPTDDTFSIKELDFIQHLETLPVHEYEPVDEQYIIPDSKKDINKIYIKSIEKLDEQKECWCLNLNDPMGLYLTENGIVTHNSLLSNLVLSYIITLFGLMRNPAQQLDKSPMTVFCIVFASATLNKAWDVIGTSFEQFIEQSPFFEKVGRHDDIVKINKEDSECKKCYYTTAARGSSKMIFRNNLNLKIVSTEGALLGNAQPLYSKIMLPDNSYTEMGRLKVGDKIKSPTEGETEVVDIFPQGKRDIFEIELDDGRKVRSSDNHLWKVAIDKDQNNNWNWQIVTTLQLIEWLKEVKDIEIYDESNAKEVKL